MRMSNYWKASNIFVMIAILCLATGTVAAAKANRAKQARNATAIIKSLLSAFPFTPVEYPRVYPESKFPDFRRNILVWVNDKGKILGRSFPKRINRRNVYFLSVAEKEEVVNGEIEFYKVETWYQSSQRVRASIAVIWSKCDANDITFEFSRVRKQFVVRDFGVTATHCIPEHE